MATKKKEKETADDWVFISEYPDEPRGEHCVRCGRKDKATIERKYPYGNYQICQNCVDYDAALKELLKKYPMETINERTKEEWDAWEKEDEEIEKKYGGTYGYCCPICGEQCLRYGKVAGGQNALILFACENPNHMGTYLVDKSGRYKRNATPKEREAKKKVMKVVLRKRLKMMLPDMTEEQLDRSVKEHSNYPVWD